MKHTPCAGSGWRIGMKLRRRCARLRVKREKRKLERLPLGKQKWMDGKLYIDDIPPYVGSEATSFLTAIIRDYLRTFAGNAYSVGGAYYGKVLGSKAWELPPTMGEIAKIQSDDDLECWKQMVNDVADAFDEADDLWRAGWAAGPGDAGDAIFLQHRRKIAEAFSALAVIFQDLNE